MYPLKKGEEPIAVPSITIIDFACIKSANFELAPVTIMIGPQGSGKSLTTKLFYFFNDILVSHIKSAESDLSEDDFKRQIARQFCQWFPPTAWGSKRFNISFNGGDFAARVLRKMSSGKPSDDVAVSFSDWFSELYRKSRKRYRDARGALDQNSSTTNPFAHSIDADFRIREQITSLIHQELGQNFSVSQTFIPAGRAFFTSLGRLVAGFEGGGNLDPVTLKFARLHASLRERASLLNLRNLQNMPEDVLNRRKTFLDKVFGGEIKYQNEIEYVETKDGRKVPFTSLSSGQQELLPMWSLIDYFEQMDYFRSRSNNINKRKFPNEVIYIEEPEAHLFPSAQSMLIEFLISSTQSNNRRRNLVMTTHSPYIMSQINVFLKAGQLSKRKKINKKINDVVPRECWLSSNDLAAYSIEDGKIKNLLDEDGLIDGAYLDGVSEIISRQYSLLLELESSL